MKKTLKKMLCGVCSAAMLMGAISFSASAAAAFTDVKPTDYFAKPVEWAVQNGITAGVSDTQFGPNQSCTRAQAMTFLWAAAGRPDPTASANFSDVKSTDYFAKAVAWAVENGITAGVGGGKFGANQPCTRGQIMTFLWRFGGSEEIQGGASFSDVSSSDYFAKPVAWAVKNEVTAGIGGGKFGPNQTCTRGQIMTMLWRADQIDVPVVPEPEKPTEPKPTEPAPTEPEVTEPAPTEPAPTEPEVTEPTHEHKWVHGAYEVACVCTNPECDYMCTESDAKSAGLELTLYYYRNHCEVVENGLTEHSYEEQVVFNPDSLSPDCWVCSECGEKTTVNPSYVVHDWVYERVNAGEQSYDKWTCSKCGVVATVDPTKLPAHPKHEHSWCSGSLTPAFECQDCLWFCTESEAERAGLTLEEFYNQNHRNTADPSLGEHNYKETKVFSMYHPAADHWICDKCGIITSINPIK